MSFGSVLDQIETVVSSHGGRTAVSDSTKSLSYSTLWEHSDFLAAYLSAQGVQQGGRVVVLLSRGVGLVTAMLAIWKLGAVYFPIDQTIPRQRLQEKLATIKPSFIFHDQEYSAADLGDCLRLDSTKLEVLVQSNRPVSFARAELAPEDISHGIYTSGTTGLGKCVVSNHRGLLNYIHSAQVRFNFDYSETFLAIARPSFSISLFEILLPLTLGCKTYIIDPLKLESPAQILSVLKRCTVAHLGPAIIKQVLQQAENLSFGADEFAHMTHLSTGGDNVSFDTMQRVGELFNCADVFILYGSSEINCMGTCYQHSSDTGAWLGRVGQAMANMELKVLNELNQPVEDGQIGRIHFSGPGLAVGYLDNDAATSAVFKIIDGRRWYDMGDLGLINENSDLELRGRSDFQVKIRGMRVEILEVEACIRGYPAVSDCVVGSRSDPHSDSKKLVAYLVLKAQVDFNLSHLIAYLNSKLPEYMLPAIYASIAQLPLSRNLKVDRRSLPEVTDANRLRPNVSQPAVGEIEQLLCAIFSRVLGVQNVLRDEDVFELGMESLAAATVIGEINKNLNAALSIKDLLECPTAQLMGMRLQLRVSSGPSSLIQLQAGDKNKPPVVFVSGSIGYLQLVRAFEVDNAVLALSLDNWVDVFNSGESDAYIKNSRNFDYLVGQYVDAAKQYPNLEGCILCGFSFAGLVALGIAERLENQGIPVSTVVLIDTHTPDYFENAGWFNRVLKTAIDLENRITSALSELLRLDRLLPDLLFKNTYTKKLQLARLQACKTMVVPALQARVVVFRASTRSFYDPNTPDLGWHKFYKDAEIVAVGGRHMGVMRGKRAAELSNVFKEVITA